MLYVTDITNLLNVHGTPPSAAEIEALRRKHARSGPLGEDSVSAKVMWYAPPILGLDLVASLAAAAVEASLPDPIGDMLRDDHSATKADWGGGIADAYVRQVRGSGRALIAAETAMLSSHRSLEAHVETVVGSVKKAIFG
jgi:hypothetical protein